MALPALLAPIISAGASLLGGLFGKSSQEKANEANLQGTRETNTMNYIMADRANAAQAAINERNISLQKEFAQTGIQWKVADAQAAGIHPLAALGAQSHSFAPVEAGQTVIPAQAPPPAIPEDAMAVGIANAGQDISRSLDAARSDEMRSIAAAQTMRALNVQRAGLENQLLASKIAVVRQAGGIPPRQAFDQRYLVPGQGQTQLPTVKDLPLERIAPDLARPSEEPGAITESGWLRLPDNAVGSRYAPVRSADAAQRLEDDLFGGLAWTIRNQLLPSIGLNTNPPPNRLAKPGYYWSFNPLLGGYDQQRMPTYKGGKSDRLGRR